MLTKSAEEVWKSLHGIICIYKPPEVSWRYLKCRISNSICNDLNMMDTRPPKEYVDFKYDNKEITLNVRPSYADNVLCVGPRYQPQDVKFHFPSILGNLSSGVLVIGINRGHIISRSIEKCNFSKCFQIKGILGQASQNYTITHKTLARAKYDHVDKYLINKMLASFQSAYQRKTFQEYGILLDSQEAYDFAVAGLHRPDKKGNPVVYDMKCIEFDPPNFTIEVNCINEKEQFLKNLIHELGINLKCLATCTGIRCIRQGCFHIEHALLKKHWTLQNIVDNMYKSFDLLNEKYKGILKYSPTLNISNEPSEENKSTNFYLS